MAGIRLEASSPQQQFLLTFESPIWQIRVDYEQGLLAFELRDSDRLQVEFAVLNLQNGQLSAPYRAPENWWMGLEDAYGRMLFLHGFGNRAIGTHQGITAVSADSYQILWQQDQTVFYGLADNSRIIARPVKAENEFFQALNAQTGVILETNINPVEAQAAVTSFNRSRTSKSNYPVHYPATSEHFALLSQFIFSHSERQGQGAIDYLETEKYLILGYNEVVAKGKWQNILGVYSATEGTLLLEEVLTASASGLVRDTFFVINNTLLFIKAKNTLVGYFV
ncbi:DUF4905 domain-containing protein [Adhaeribacter arboris]|uniref:DUF4905 domain-containing protein n=1 Tax=Adhaeribacter arboris TaxID=2072846 RepID=UPI001304F4E5|nr:DUF4905 domain-containing protein [Adhaeribacter arboris]